MPATQRTVLVVDDDPHIRSILTLLLSGEGFAVVAAADGREGLVRFRAGGPPPCLVLLDLRMPRLDGWQFLRERGRDPALAAVPVVVLSSESDAGECVDLGAADVLAKPFGLQALADVVRKHCGGPLPGLNGYDVVHQIRPPPLRRDVFRVALTDWRGRGRPRPLRRRGTNPNDTTERGR